MTKKVLNIDSIGLIGSLLVDTLVEENDYEGIFASFLDEQVQLENL